MHQSPALRSSSSSSLSSSSSSSYTPSISQKRSDENVFTKRQVPSFDSSSFSSSSPSQNDPPSHTSQLPPVIYDSSEELEEKINPLTNKRKIKASSLLSSPSLFSHLKSPPLTKKLTPQTLLREPHEVIDFEREKEDNERGGMKKMRLNPHSLDDPPFSHSSSDDASDSPSGKRDHAPVSFDKPLNDIDCSSSPSSKLPSSSPSPSLSRLVPRTLSLSSSSSSPPIQNGGDTNPPPITKSFSFAGDDLLSSSHDFLDQFRFNKSSSSSTSSLTSKFTPNRPAHNSPSKLHQNKNNYTNNNINNHNNIKTKTLAKTFSEMHTSNTASSAIVID